MKDNSQGDLYLPTCEGFLHEEPQPLFKLCDLLTNFPQRSHEPMLVYSSLLCCPNEAWSTHNLEPQHSTVHQKLGRSIRESLCIAWLS